MAKTVITLKETDALYQSFIDAVNQATDDQLIIVARSEKNRKPDNIKPVAVKNGIYFYIAYSLNNKLAFPSKYTQEQLAVAKANTVKNARLSDGLDIIFEEGKTIDDYDSSDVPMIIVSSVSKMNAAGILLCSDFLNALMDKIGDYYIIPSSIHEIIISPKTCDLEKDALSVMVREVNAAEVSDEEVLGDRAYDYSEWA